MIGSDFYPWYYLHIALQFILPQEFLPSRLCLEGNRSHWEGGWKIVKVVSSINMQIQDGKRTRVVHVNHLRHHFNQLWRKREFRMKITLHGHHHRSNIAYIVPCDDLPPPPSTRRYPSRIRCPPEYFNSKRTIAHQGEKCVYSHAYCYCYVNVTSLLLSSHKL